MSWDDEDFDIKVNNNNAPVSWEEEEQDDEPVLDSWDALSDDEKPKTPASAPKSTTSSKKKGKKNISTSGTKTLTEIDLVDEKTRKEMLKEEELNADLNNAADLFGSLGVSEHPRARAAAAEAANKKPVLKLTTDTPLDVHPLFQPTTKQDFEKLRKTLGSEMKKLDENSHLFYSSVLAVDLTRDICDPLSIEQIRKVISTLNALVTKKVKDERQNRLAKTGGTSLGGAGKKKAKTAVVNTGPASFKKDNLDDFMGGNDDMSDDDFM